MKWTLSFISNGKDFDNFALGYINRYIFFSLYKRILYYIIKHLSILKTIDTNWVHDICLIVANLHSISDLLKISLG